MTTPLSPAAVEVPPIAVDRFPEAFAVLPIAVDEVPVAFEVKPNETLLDLVA